MENYKRLPLEWTKHMKECKEQVGALDQNRNDWLGTEAIENCANGLDLTMLKPKAGLLF